MTVQRSLLILSLLLAGCSGKPDLPTRDRAIEIFKNQRSDSSFTVYTFDEIDCEYRDPQKNAQNGRWMAFCVYDTIKTFTANKFSQPTVTREQITIRIHWHDNYGPDGKKLWR